MALPVAGSCLRALFGRVARRLPAEDTLLEVSEVSEKCRPVHRRRAWGARDLAPAGDCRGQRASGIPGCREGG